MRMPISRARPAAACATDPYTPTTASSSAKPPSPLRITAPTRWGDPRAPSRSRNVCAAVIRRSSSNARISCRIAAARARAFPAVRPKTAPDQLASRRFCSQGRKAANPPVSRSRRPKRPSPTTPTTRTSRRGSAVNRAPSGSRSPHRRRASAALTTATGSRPSTSRSPRSRPASSRNPSVRTYPGPPKNTSRRAGNSRISPSTSPRTPLRGLPTSGRFPKAAASTPGRAARRGTTRW